MDSYFLKKLFQTSQRISAGRSIKYVPLAAASDFTKVKAQGGRLTEFPIETMNQRTVRLSGQHHISASGGSSDGSRVRPGHPDGCWGWREALRQSHAIEESVVY